MRSRVLKFKGHVLRSRSKHIVLRSRSKHIVLRSRRILRSHSKPLSKSLSRNPSESFYIKCAAGKNFDYTVKLSNTFQILFGDK